MDALAAIPQSVSSETAPTPAVRLEAAGHEVQIFTDSLSLMKAMEQAVRSARRRVWLETYIFVADAAGSAIGEALKDRARAGLDVRLIYDAIGCARTPRAFFTDLAQAGVQVHAYNSLSEALNHVAPLQVLNRRDHRKLLVIDDDAAFFGGMNIVDQTGITTLAEAKARRLPASAGWRDVHLRLAGPQQGEVAAAFDRLWRRRLHKRRVRWPPWPMRDLHGDDGEALWFFDSQPGWRYRSPVRVFVPLIGRAQHEITLSMAYFLPVGRVLRALYAAARRGVAVRVVVPAQSDVKLVRWASRHLYARLLRRGIRIFERQDQMLHSKVMVVDGRFSVVGSCNFDPRSLWLNLEFLAVFRSERMARALLDICAFEIEHSREVTLDDTRRRRWWQRLLDRTAYSLRRWL